MTRAAPPHFRACRPRVAPVAGDALGSVRRRRAGHYRHLRASYSPGAALVDCRRRAGMGQDHVSEFSSSEVPVSTAQAVARGARAATRSIFSFVIFSTYIGFGALAHDLNFSLAWIVLSTPLIWAGPAQVIVVSTLGTGTTLIQSAIAVGLSGIRLLPMAASMLPLLRTERTRWYHMMIPAHFTAVAFWIEALRLLPAMPRENRLAFANGFCLVLAIFGISGTFAGYFLAAQLPPLLAAAVLFISPMSFLVSTAGNAKLLVDRLALGFGLVLSPLLAAAKVELHLLVTGLVAGTLAYLIHRSRRATP